MKKKRYQFTKAGAEHFTRSALNDIFTALESDKEPPNIIVTVGRRSIEIPTYAEIWEELETFIENSIKEFNNEN